MDKISAITRLQKAYPWPEEKPNLEYDLQGWLCGENMEFLRDSIAETDAKLVVELGSWKGLSTTFICEHCTGFVIAIDHWQGSYEHEGLGFGPELPFLYDKFIRNCWDFKDRLIPVRETTIKGLQTLAEMDLDPDVIYIDAAHDTASVREDLSTCLKFFPKAIIIGDDYSHESVRRGVAEALSQEFIGKTSLETFGVAYRVKVHD